MKSYGHLFRKDPFFMTRLGLSSYSNVFIFVKNRDLVCRPKQVRLWSLWELYLSGLLVFVSNSKYSLGIKPESFSIKRFYSESILFLNIRMARIVEEFLFFIALRSLTFSLALKLHFLFENKIHMTK